jgi:hypothetical protein
MGNVRAACAAVATTQDTVYKLRKKSKSFAERWATAVDAAADRLEAEAWRRAHDGTLEPVFYKGEECGTIRKYSDVLLIFLLKGMRPDKYRERYQSTLVGDKASPVAVRMEVELKSLSDEELLKKSAEAELVLSGSETSETPTE